MQVVDRRTASLPSQGLVRAMALFGTIMAALLLAAAVIYGAVIVSGAFGTTNTGSAIDPLAAPEIVQFRNSEHAAAVWTGDLLAQPGLSQFRNSEHAGAGQSSASDPLSLPSLVEFRNSEHSEAR